MVRGVTGVRLGVKTVFIFGLFYAEFTQHILMKNRKYTFFVHVIFVILRAVFVPLECA